MKKTLLCLFLTVALNAAVLAKEKECASKLQGYINKSSHKFNTLKACEVWATTDGVAIPRGEGAVGTLMVAAQEGETIVVAIVIQSKAKFKLSVPLLLKLLRMNHELSYVKVGIDDDGDLFARTELRAKTLTAEEFGVSLKTVVDAGAQTFAMLK